MYCATVSVVLALVYSSHLCRYCFLFHIWLTFHSALCAQLAVTHGLYSFSTSQAVSILYDCLLSSQLAGSSIFLNSEYRTQNTSDYFQIKVQQSSSIQSTFWPNKSIFSLLLYFLLMIKHFAYKTKQGSVHILKGEPKKNYQSFFTITRSNFTQILKSWTFLNSSSSWLLKNVQDH